MKIHFSLIYFTPSLNPAKTGLFAAPQYLFTQINLLLKVQSCKLYYIHVFSEESEPQKPKILNKMLRKSPASNVRAGICKNADFTQSSLKATNLCKFWGVFYLKFFSVFIIKKMTFIVCVKPN